MRPARDIDVQIQIGEKKWTEVQMAKLAQAYGGRVDGWLVKDEVKRTSGVTGTDIKTIAAIYQHEAEEMCALAFSGTEMSPADVQYDLNVLTGQWCGLEGLHQGFANSMSSWWKKYGGKRQVKKLARMSCPKGIIAVGHSLGGAKAALFAACANSNNGWLESEIFGAGTRAQRLGVCRKVCSWDQCARTATNGLQSLRGQKSSVLVSSLLQAAALCGGEPATIAAKCHTIPSPKATFLRRFNCTLLGHPLSLAVIS